MNNLGVIEITNEDAKHLVDTYIKKPFTLFEWLIEMKAKGYPMMVETAAFGEPLENVLTQNYKDYLVEHGFATQAASISKTQLHSGVFGTNPHQVQIEQAELKRHKLLKTLLAKSGLSNQEKIQFEIEFNLINNDLNFYQGLRF